MSVYVLCDCVCVYGVYHVSSSDSPPICQACIEKISQPPAISTTTAAQDDLASRRIRGNRRSSGGRQQRFVTFGPVTEMDQRCWERLSIARPRQEDEEEEDEEERDESQTLRRLLSTAPVTMPTIGMSSPLRERLGRYCPLLAGTPLGMASCCLTLLDPAACYPIVYIVDRQHLYSVYYLVVCIVDNKCVCVYSAYAA